MVINIESVARSGAGKIGQDVYRVSNPCPVVYELREFHAAHGAGHRPGIDPSLSWGVDAPVPAVTSCWKSCDTLLE